MEVRGIFVEPNGGTNVANPLGGSVVFKVGGKETNGAMTAFIAVNTPGTGPPLHTHANEDELMVVTDGMFRFQIGDERREAGVGAVAYIPRGLPHTWRVIGEQREHVHRFLTRRNGTILRADVRTRRRPCRARSVPPRQRNRHGSGRGTACLTDHDVLYGYRLAPFDLPGVRVSAMHVAASGCADAGGSGWFSDMGWA